MLGHFFILQTTIYRIRELREKNDEALAILTEKQRRRILMRYVDEMTLEEIAKAEKCDISTIKELIASGIKKIQKNFKKHPQK